MKVRIIAVPPGFAPAEIREQWLNLELPLVTEAELAADPPSGRIGNQNGEGYVILREGAIEVLKANGKQAAADFWQSLPLGKYLVFAKQCCELAPSESLNDAITRRLREGATKTEVCRELGADRRTVEAIDHYIHAPDDAE